MKVVAALALAGCLPGPEVGALLTTGDASLAIGDAAPGCNNDSDPATAVSYSVDIVSGVFVRGKCMSCHTGGGEGVQQSGLDLGSYAKLRAGGRHSGANIVIDFQPCSSIVVLKIDITPPFGKRMPYNGPPYLASRDIQLVRDWIAEGARDN
jgi:hypothetical protein